jgi:DNA-binding NtrC family response regulator
VASAAVASRRVLVVDDDEGQLRSLRGLLKPAPVEVSTAAGIDSALALLSGGVVFDLALVDYILRGESGVDLMVRLSRLDPELPLVLVSGCVSAEAVPHVQPHLARAFLGKPFHLDDVLRLLAEFPRGAGAEVAPLPTRPPTLDEFTIQHVVDAIAECGGNKSQAARMLGIHRTTLMRYLARVR